MKRTRPWKTTDEETKKTVQERSKAVGETRRAVSGGSSGTQLNYKLKAMSKQGREAILKEALGKDFNTIPRDDILAMKVDLGETCYKVETLWR